MSLSDWSIPLNLNFSSSDISSICNKRLLMALWERLETPIFLFCFKSSIIIFAEIHVLPVPGGPWITKKEEFIYFSE